MTQNITNFYPLESKEKVKGGLVGAYNIIHVYIKGGRPIFYKGYIQLCTQL